MNAFLKKEIRLLLPSFLIGCALTLSNWLLLWEQQHHDAFSNMLSFIPEMACPAVAVMIALNSFGVEINSGTFTNLLSQPISRLKIWETKISLLAGALLAGGVLWFVPVFCVGIFSSNNIPSDAIDLNNIFVIAVMFTLVVFSGGLWTVLLLRQVAAAFWFTLLVPGVLLMIVTTFFIDGDRNFFEGMIISVLGLYSLAGFFFARWLFFRAQDVQWSGGTIAMPEMRGLPAWLAKSSIKRIFRPRAALWRKEFQLHQSQFIMAFALLLLHLGVIAMRNFYDLSHSPDLKYVLEIFWGLWFVMPVLVGCAAVAEERKIGTLEGQLCLPVKRRTQFAIKLFVALFLSVFLGAVMPLLLEGIKILPNIHFGFNGLTAVAGLAQWVQNPMSTAQIFFWDCLGELDDFLPLLTLAGIAATFGLISFYVSSLARNTLQTLAPAVLGILLTFFVAIGVAEMREFNLDFLWRGPLPYFIGVPVMLVALVALAFWNFQHVRTGWRMWRQNFFALGLALAFSVAVTSAIYHRAWEKLTPFESPHGAARLSQANPASLNAQGSGISVRLPDGKIWMGYFTSELNDFNPIARLLGNFKVAMADGKFINGSNWLTVQYCYRELVGIKTDGSLWVSEGVESKGSFQNGKWIINQDKMQHLMPFGNETNWSSVEPMSWFKLLVKNDGTLWRWGATNWNWKNEWPGLRSFAPQRLGTESNWAEAFLSDYHQLWLRKIDGSVWTTLYNKENTNQTIELEPGFSIQRTSIFEHDKWRSMAAVRSGLDYQLGIRDDGTFRLGADEKLNGKTSIYEWAATDFQFGTATSWLGVAGSGEKIVTLKNDGSLWLWNFHHDDRRGWDPERDEQEMLAVKPVHLGTHSDWIAIASAGGGIISLAADGSLWYWPLERSDNYGKGDNSHFEPLLDISRKPQLLGNIFGKADLQ